MTPAEYREIARALRNESSVPKLCDQFQSSIRQSVLNSLASVADHMAEWLERNAKCKDCGAEPNEFHLPSCPKSKTP